LKALQIPQIQSPTRGRATTAAHFAEFHLQTPLPWIEVAERAPYFVTDTGDSWTPIGQNDAITWPELVGLFRRRDLVTADRYLAMLAAHGVTVLRLMLEYCHREHRYLERPVGRMVPDMVRLWDDLFAACERHGLRILLTPFDTFWTWLRWRKHPYNTANGGPCPRRSELLTSRETRKAIKRRLEFATERWGGSGVLFAWDLWNEIHSAHAEDCAAHFSEFIADVGGSLRKMELRLHGRSHPQTVSIFGPHIESDPCIAEAIFRHPQLDFASSHFYEAGTIDHPRDTIAPAVSTGRLTRKALAETRPMRPFLDSEHGPIHTYKDHHRTLPEPFDDEYFRHMQWAHFASGGVGGGMRWPNRKPHSLTAGMRRAQLGLSRFLPLIDWQNFRRRNLNEELVVESAGLAPFACGDAEQAVIWLLRTDRIGANKLVEQGVAGGVRLKIPGLRAGTFRVCVFNTMSGEVCAEFQLPHGGTSLLQVDVPPFGGDIALALRVEASGRG
jgi:mannan endo-1,4-beta-mannosidase